MAVSTGDSGVPSGFPAVSTNVVAVGGTALYIASARGAYSYESAWGGLTGGGAGSGGLSTVYAAPSYQSQNGVVYTKRATPDVSMVADTTTAVSVYDSYDSSVNNGSPWTAFGGTSVAAPIFAGVLTLAQEDRVDAGHAPLTSAQTLNLLYQAYNSSSYSTYFHDVTVGSNTYKYTSRGRTVTVTGYSAVAKYDLATGIGSPIANTLVPYLAASATSSSIIGVRGSIGAAGGAPQ